MSGATSRSSTSSPSRRRTSAPTDSSPAGASAGRARSAARPLDARGGEDAGGGHGVEVGGHAEQLFGRQPPQGALAPHERRARRGRHQVGGEAQLAAQLDRVGHPGQEGVGRLVDQAVAEGGGPELAAHPVAGLDHHHRRAPAHALPGGGQPADAPADDRQVDPRHPAAARTAGGEGGHHRGLVVDGGGAGEGQAPLGGQRGGVDVEVVEDLQVVGHEALRAHQHAGGRPGVRDAVDHLEDVGPPPRLGRAPRRLPGQRPAAAHPRRRRRPSVAVVDGAAGSPTRAAMAAAEAASSSA